MSKIAGRQTRFFLDDAGGVLRDISSVIRKVGGIPGKTDRPESGGFGEDGLRYEVLGKSDGGTISLGGIWKSQALTKTHGRQARLAVDELVLQGYIRTIAISRMVDIPDTDAFADDFKRREVVGKKSGSLSLGGLFESAAGLTDAAFWAAFRATVPSIVTVGHQGFAIGNTVEMLTPYETDYGIDSDHMTSPTPVKADFLPDGVIDLGVALHDYVQETGAAPVNYTGVDETAVSTALGWVAHIHVSQFAGTTVTVKIQDSADNVTFADLTGGTFTAVVGVTKERLVGASNAVVRRYVRCIISAATYTSMTFTVAFGRRGSAHGAIGSYRQLVELYGLAATTTFQYGPEGSTVGNRRYTGEARLQQLDVSIDHSAGPVEFTATLLVDGVLTRDTF